jgi:hypothetical protein
VLAEFRISGLSGSTIGGIYLFINQNNNEIIPALISGKEYREQLDCSKNGNMSD